MPAFKRTGHMFKPSPKPVGHHPGWVFKHGHLGLGYYRDSGEVARSGHHMPTNDVACERRGMCLVPDCTLPRADVLLVYGMLAADPFQTFMQDGKYSCDPFVLVLANYPAKYRWRHGFSSTLGIIPGCKDRKIIVRNLWCQKHEGRDAAPDGGVQLMYHVIIQGEMP